MVSRKKLSLALAILALVLSTLGQPTHARGPGAVTDYLFERLAFDLASRETGRLAGENVAARLARSRKLISELPEHQLSVIRERFKLIEQRHAETWGKKSRHGERGTKDPIQPIEKAWLDELLLTELRINPKWRPGASNDIQFLNPSALETGAYRANSEAFLKETPKLALVDDAARELPAAARPKATRNFKRFMNDMGSCVKNSPELNIADFNFRYTMVNLAVDETMTIGGAIAASLLSSGSLKDVDLNTLPQDLAFEAMTSLGDSLLASRTAGLKVNVQWFKVRVSRGAALQLWGQGQAGSDAVLYYFTAAQAENESRAAATAQRAAFNSAWNAAYAPLSIKLYDLFAGIDCMRKTGNLGLKGGWVIGAQFGVGLALNTGYFGLRMATGATAD